MARIVSIEDILDQPRTTVCGPGPRGMPPEEIRLKLIGFEQLDMCYEFAQMKAQTHNDADIGSWWVEWVSSMLFVWRFLFAPKVDADGHWLRAKYRETVGETTYNAKIKETEEYLESVGETVEMNV